tara:strand:- start:252 stop:968 length:717 start_codon:yes stop_codon:yes gene_type:complete
MAMIFSVEGNIGSGKSTLIKHLKEQMKEMCGFKIVYLEEPVDIWQTIKDSQGNDIIKRYYEDQKKFAFQFQMMAYITRITQLRKAIQQHKNCIIITERSILTDKNVFAKMLRDNGTLDEISHQIYLKWFDELSMNLKIDSSIYIKTNPETSLKRVIKRNRPGETITLDYLKICHENHEKWLQNDESVLLLNGETEYSNEIPWSWLLAIKTYLKNMVEPLVEQDYVYDLLHELNWTVGC